MKIAVWILMRLADFFRENGNGPTFFLHNATEDILFEGFELKDEGQSTEAYVYSAITFFK